VTVPTPEQLEAGLNPYGISLEAPPQPQPRRDAKPKKVRGKIEPEPEGQLEQLLIQYKRAKDEFEERKEAEAQLKAQIKAWVLSLYPGGQGLPEAFDITGDPHGRYDPLTMTLKGGKRTDIEQMKQDGIYERYQKETTPSWELRVSEQRGRR
jgi:hypothetical protein